ncbi:MAG TPA: flagellar motor switch protein FliN [Steroidobacteraceae bacterium]|nr:flagellar motor switch protein FliN [Steroidobacteraceae bacterium]
MASQPQQGDSPATAAPTDPAAAAGEVDVGAILDVPVTMSLEVGRARLTIGELLQLGPGSIVELDRAAGEPLDVLLNGRLVARGEVVVTDDRFGIRLLDIVSRADRLQNLG